MNTTLKQTVNLIATLQPVKGNSLYSKDTKKFYIVYSYGEHFPIAVYNSLDDTWLLNEDKYSVTTSKHQSIVKQAIGIYAPKLCSLKAIKQVINGEV